MEQDQNKPKQDKTKWMSHRQQNKTEKSNEETVRFINQKRLIDEKRK
jgi:hypothetical protein